MIEGGGCLDRVTVTGDNVAIETIKDGFLQPTGVTRDGNTAWVTEGQLSRLKGEARGFRSEFMRCRYPSTKVSQPSLLFPAWLMGTYCRARRTIGDGRDAWSP